MDRPNYITPTGYATLRAEYEQLFATERPALVETIAWAAGNGDRSENGDYIYGRKRLREIDRRLGWLSKRMKAAKVVDPAKQEDRTRAWFGATVTVVDEDDRADLDDRLLVLYCAAAILAESGAKDTNLKLEAAQRHFARLKADQVQSEPFSLFGVRNRHPRREREPVMVGNYKPVQPAPEPPAPEPQDGTPFDFVAIYQQAKPAPEPPATIDGTPFDFVALYQQAKQ